MDDIISDMDQEQTAREQQAIRDELARREQEYSGRRDKRGKGGPSFDMT
jgi:hypothetical protein